MELFFTDTTSAFFALSSTAIRETLHSHLRSMKLPRLSRFLGKTAEERWQNDDCAARWARGELSNLAYLLRVNRLAGRSYNDLSQYYVMPWVLRDYESAQLDLSDPRVYRDFSLSIGAQKPERRALVQEKFEMMKELRAQQEQLATEDLDLLAPPPRHYATHYSNSTLVIWWLLRLEPFTSLHVFVQDGRFDRPDRQFHSVASAWRGSTESDGDVKELVPEFFTVPQMFRNGNGWAWPLRIIAD